ncbi:hypothetical protein E4U59_001210 [Claviceps monticola]|nr:hypothetical protein E4U59_001210 [Claviceps monticola]
MVYSAAHIKHMQHLEVTGLPGQEASHQPPFSVPSGRPYGPRVCPTERDAQLALRLGKKSGLALVVIAATVAPHAIESSSGFGGQVSRWCCRAFTKTADVYLEEGKNGGKNG